jgi:hypothetical protein
VAAGLFYVLRRLETWLHQHLFKVGWLTTKNFQTTTILYYTFFLPGVVLHELTYWLAAGLLNVRAERAIQWPEKQEIGELKLNFVKLAPRSSLWRVAIITLCPLIIGILTITLIANNIFQLPSLLAASTPVTLQNLNSARQVLFQTPDFWLWFYVAFTISNTMIPDLAQSTGWRRIGIVLGVIVTVLVVIGLGNAVVLGVLTGGVANILNAVSGVFAIIIVINVFMVGVLSVIENTIEFITGDSADFRNGKMITMTREERMTSRMREIEKQRQARERKRSGRRAEEIGPPSIYKQPLPLLPGAPGDEAVTPLQKVIPKDEPPTLKSRSSRAGADLIEGKLSDDQRQLPTGKTKADTAT